MLLLSSITSSRTKDLTRRKSRRRSMCAFVERRSSRETRREEGSQWEAVESSGEVKGDRWVPLRRRRCVYVTRRSLIRDVVSC